MGRVQGLARKLVWHLSLVCSHWQKYKQRTSAAISRNNLKRLIPSLLWAPWIALRDSRGSRVRPASGRLATRLGQGTGVGSLVSRGGGGQGRGGGRRGGREGGLVKESCFRFGGGGGDGREAGKGLTGGEEWSLSECSSVAGTRNEFEPGSRREARRGWRAFAFSCAPLVNFLVSRFHCVSLFFPQLISERPLIRRVSVSGPLTR